MTSAIIDRVGRPLRDLRISVTDRCNFRCTYCMPKEVFGDAYRFLDPAAILSYEEIARIARLFAAAGVQKLRITGGEPLVRARIETLIAMLQPIRGLHDLALTTNGALLASKAHALRAAGLRRITVSLDSLDQHVFDAMNGVGFPVGRVLDGIRAAQDAGLSPVKVNVVVRRGVNDHTVVDMARHFHASGVIVRFIEYMDVGESNGWRREHVVPGAEIVCRIDAELPLEPVAATYGGEVAKRYRYRDGGGEIGIITSVSHPFCGDCTRARLSSAGRLYTCLFGAVGLDLRSLLRAGADDEHIAGAIHSAWRAREDRYSELRSGAAVTSPKVEMSHIGG